MHKSFVLVSLALLFLYLCSCEEKQLDLPSNAETLIPATIDFNFHVKPILSDKCFKCHGPDANKREGNLALHTADFAYAALDSSAKRFAIVKGDTAKSIMHHVIHSSNQDEQMPPPSSQLKLSEREKRILSQWIDQGAQYKEHWSLTPPLKHTPPDIASEWAANDVDLFIEEKLNQKGLKPSPLATAEKLIRRLHFSLTGLPPTVNDIEQYLSNPTVKNYELIVDSLLNSDAYTEYMTQIWMDVSRYADSHGYQDDPERFMWPWRDWVIHSYGENMPFDQFVTWQLAGDMLPEATLEQIIASGFNRNHKITYEGGSIPEEFRTEYVADRIHTFGTAFLGLTAECARCHDHKYDPFSQQNYFELFAFFNNVPEQGLVEPVGKTPEPFVTLSKEEIHNTLGFIKSLDTIEAVELMVMEEMSAPRNTYILERGQYDKPSRQVFPNTPKSILNFGNRQTNRLGLAEWLFDKNHPLTARVAVNRLWQQIFGQGIVATPYDFGNQGALPSHPELLDYLALKYQEEGWDTKALLKFLVMSSTFQQTSKILPSLLEKDPENQYLARFPRLRLSSEMIRDQVLKSAGILTNKIGGPSVKPYQPAGLWEETIGGGGDLRNYVEDKGENLYRRSLYTFWKRTSPPPNMTTFDASTKDLCTVVRQETNTPLQALVLLNDPQMIEAARLLAHNAIALVGANPKKSINYMFAQMTSRQATQDELDLLEKYFHENYDYFEQNTEEARAYLSVGNYDLGSEVSDESLAAYSLVANMIFNLDEVIHRG